ncbi:UNVERIFIED_CONTAM: Retrovirus-related Pol polyprotein from transposon RE1 [Sesamum indicum]
MLSPSADDSVSIPDTESASLPTFEPTLPTPASSATPEPNSFFEAVQHKEWREAMDTELNALEANHTWKVAPLPPGKCTIGCKWVFKTKLREDGSLERYKARLEDLFMLPLKGYDVPPNLVCKLQRSLYSLKQASRQSNAVFTLKLVAYGFAQSVHDHYLFVKLSCSSLMALLVYVDDILITGPSLDDIDQVKWYLRKLFSIKDMGHASYFLGHEIARSASGLYVAQRNMRWTLSRTLGWLKQNLSLVHFPLV